MHLYTHIQDLNKELTLLCISIVDTSTLKQAGVVYDIKSIKTVVSLLCFPYQKGTNSRDTHIGKLLLILGEFTSWFAIIL